MLFFREICYSFSINKIISVSNTTVWDWTRVSWGVDVLLTNTTPQLPFLLQRCCKHYLAVRPNRNAARTTETPVVLQWPPQKNCGGLQNKNCARILHNSRSWRHTHPLLILTLKDSLRLICGLKSKISGIEEIISVCYCFQAIISIEKLGGICQSYFSHFVSQKKKQFRTIVILDYRSHMWMLSVHSR